LAALPESAKVDLGFKQTEFIVDCRYDGTECDVNTYVFCLLTQLLGYST